MLEERTTVTMVDESINIPLLMACHSNNCTVHNNALIFTIKTWNLSSKWWRYCIRLQTSLSLGWTIETLAGIYTAAVKVCINDIVHALTMRIASAVRLHYSMSPQAAF